MPVLVLHLTLKITIAIGDQLNFDGLGHGYQNYSKLKLYSLLQKLSFHISMFYLLFWFTLIVLTLQSSPTNKTIDQLQAGTFVLKAIENDQNNLFMWQFQTPFETTPQLAFAINKMASSSQNASSSYNVSPQAVTKIGVILSFKRISKKWISIHLNYLATTRNDLVFGHQETKIVQNSSAISEVSINPPLKSLKTTIARMYLTGCSAGDSVFDCGVSGKALTATTLTVTVYASQQNSTLKELFVSFSYILFSPSEAKFSSYGGMLDREMLTGTSSESIHKSIYATEYLLFGFSKLSFTPSNPQNITIDIDSDMVLTFSTQQPIQFRFLYIVIGKSSIQTCPDESNPYQWDGYCIDKCPNSTYLEEYQNKGKACRSCSDKLHKELFNNSCICKQGFQMVDDRCLKSEEKLKAVSSKPEEVKQNSENITKELLSKQKDMKKLSEELSPAKTNEKYKSMSKREQKEDKKEKGKEQNNTIKGFDTKLQKRKEECQKEQITEKVDMTQYPSYISENSMEKPQQPKKCQGGASVQDRPIQLPSFIEQQQQVSVCPSSIPSCGPNSYFLKNICLCLPGFINIYGQCVESTSEFTLLPIYVDDFPSLPQHHDHNNTHGCLTPQACIPPAFLDSNGHCVCPRYFVMFKGNCVSCPYPGLFDYNQGKCVELCKENEIFDNVTQKCKCRHGFGFGKDGRCMICEGESFLYKGFCVSCGEGRVYDSGCKKCVCPNGTLQDISGKCVTRCGQNQHFNNDIGSCVCDMGFGRIKGRCSLCPDGQAVDKNGVCTPCEANQEVLEGICSCKKGFVLKNNRCVPCQNLPNSFLFDQLCSTCSPGYELVEGQCKCQQSFAMYNNQCLPCNQIPGAVNLNGKCLKCESGVIHEGQCVNSSTFALQKNEETQKRRIVYLGKPSVCGNGFVEEQQECDDRNNIDGDGCSSKCEVQKGFSCDRMPSRCQPNNGTIASQLKNQPSLTPKESHLIMTPNTKNTSNTSNTSNTTNISNTSKTVQPPPPSSPTTNISTSTNNSNLWLEGDIYGNSNQIFIVLNTKTAFNFSDQSQMQKFLKARFDGIRPPTVFFSQRPAPNKQLFDCLLIFGSGVPNDKFSIDFSYQRDSTKGEALVLVDPLAITAPTRSRRPGRDRA